MKIYVLLKESYDIEGKRIICVSENINKIRESMCRDFDPNGDYPTLEIWQNETIITKVSGSIVLRIISNEINNKVDEEQ